MERVDSMLRCKGSIFLELSTLEKTSRELLHWFLSHWRKQGGQASSCSRKWRSKEGPAQALHSCSMPVPLNKLNTAAGELECFAFKKELLLLYVLDFLLVRKLRFWNSALATSWLPPASYNVCYPQAGRKAVSTIWALCEGNRFWRRETWPTTGGARGLLLAWVFILELDRCMG